MRAYLKKYGVPKKCVQCGVERIVDKYTRPDLCFRCSISTTGKRVWAKNLSQRTHGMRHTKLYQAWSCMKTRCFNTKNAGWHNYGGRGITVCHEWRKSFVSFAQWSMANGYREGLELDRKDTNGNYEPQNCRWVEDKVNNRNRRNVKLSVEKAAEIRSLVKKGKSVSDLANMYSVNYCTVRDVVKGVTWL